MILIFGGAYQGKLDYAAQRFKLTENDIYRCSEDHAGEPERKRIIYELDKWVLALIRAGIYSEDLVKKYISESGDAIVICNDISCGVVPIDPELRAWREAVGRALAVCAAGSQEVVRLYCGIPTSIKG